MKRLTDVLEPCLRCVKVQQVIQQEKEREPELSLVKGVVGSTNGLGVFDPDPAGPVNFEPPLGTTSPPFSPAFNSDDLAANPIDSNLDEADASAMHEVEDRVLEAIGVGATYARPAEGDQP